MRQVSISLQRVTRPISPSHIELREPGSGRGPFWVEYRSGGTGGPHPGMNILNIFPDLSPRVKPYCEVKCSQGFHYCLLQSQKGNLHYRNIQRHE